MGATQKAIDQLNKYVKELKEADEQLAKVKKGTKEYSQALKTQETAYKNAKKAAQGLQGAMVNLSPNFNSHKKLIASSSEAMNGYSKATTKASGGQKGFAGSLVSSAKSLGRYLLAFKLINVAIQAFNFFTTDSIKKGAEFEAAVANLSAVAGVSGQSLNSLKEAALDVAGQTKFTANEIVGLQTELSKLGFSADDVVAATGSIAFGAQALGESLESVAGQVGKIINQFNLLAEESSMVVDTVVTTINESALSLNTFGTAIQYVGPLAEGLGLNLQQTAGAMATLADNGFTASRIGTGLRGILTELGTETVDVKSKLKELADENLSLSEAVDLVGKRNAAQLITLVDNIDVLDESEDKFYNQGRAMVAAATQADTFQGQMDILKSAIDAYQISIGDAIIQSGFFQTLLTKLAPEASKTAKAFQVIKEIGATAFSEDLQKIVTEGADVRTLAIQRVAEATGESIEKVTAKLRLQEGFMRTSIMSDGTYRQEVEVLVQSENDLGQSVQGLIDKYKELEEQERKNIIVSKARTDVENEYQSKLDDLIIREQLGENIVSDADALAEEVKAKMIAARKEIENQEEAITNARGGAYEKQLQDAKLAKEAELKELSSFYRSLANLVGIEKKDQEESEKIVRRRADNFKFLTDSYADYAKEQERLSGITELENEANENFMANTDERLRLNKELIAANEELMMQLQNEIAVRTEAIAKEDANTKQGAYNISIYEKEIETLERLIMKYENKNDALGVSADVIRDAQSNFESQLKVLEKEYSEGDIGTKAFNQRRAELLADFKAQLKAIADSDPEFKAATEALFKKISGDQENPIDWRDIISNGLDEAISTATDALDNFNQVSFDNLKNRLEAEKEALKARYDEEDYLAKQQFENGLINEQQYKRRQQALRKKQIAEENAIDKQIFEAEKKRDKNSAKTSYLEALGSIIPELIKAGKVIPTDLAISSAISAALATAAFGAEMSAINQRQFFPKKFAQGGMVEGPSHAQGGVPFTVQGRGGYEMEGGEFIVNKRASSLHRDLLERINSSVKPVVPSQPMKFAQGGVVTSNVTNVSEETRESVNYLKAIAEATTTNAINSSKPVRAFVTSKDLRNDESARRIKDNNTII